MLRLTLPLCFNSMIRGVMGVYNVIRLSNV